MEDTQTIIFNPENTSLSNEGGLIVTYSLIKP